MNETQEQAQGTQTTTLQVEREHDGTAAMTMRQFARAATIRAVRTMAQTAASLLGAKALISDVDWKALLSATVMSGILSILTAVYTGLPETEVTEVREPNK